MSVLLLVRHGQASFGEANYDRLSDLGVRQARDLGRDLTRRGVTPTTVQVGTLDRQRTTARALTDAMATPLAAHSDAAWDEFEYTALEEGQAAAGDSRAFQVELENAMRGWVAGAPGSRFAESFETFAARTRRALADTSRRGPGTHLVVTSAGVISLIAADLLGGGTEQWVRLSRVCVNSSVTKIVVGRGGVSLVSFNDHGHLDPDLVTYR